MNLTEYFHEIYKKRDPYKVKTRFRIVCTDGITLTGDFAGLTSALDNEPEIAEISIYRDDNGDLTGILETEIKNIELVEDP